MVLISLVPVLNLLYFYISTFRSMCLVSNMALFCSSFTSRFLLLLLLLIIIIIILFVLAQSLQLYLLLAAKCRFPEDTENSQFNSWYRRSVSHHQSVKPVSMAHSTLYCTGFIAWSYRGRGLSLLHPVIM